MENKYSNFWAVIHTPPQSVIFALNYLSTIKQEGGVSKFDICSIDFYPILTSYFLSKFFLMRRGAKITASLGANAKIPYTLTLCACLAIPSSHATFHNSLYLFWHTQSCQIAQPLFATQPQLFPPAAIFSKFSFLTQTLSSKKRKLWKQPIIVHNSSTFCPQMSALIH